ncbi:hypothetical protein [Anaerostipes sp.]|uniref:hypothetical protein n=1 Tax=Anaerostipes sp. TaxID=1872530 RepID=UPI0025C665C7|nr:hypothetical protein [Anaerostipes sp.]MBS7009288.1 hypothetical protein [Anaerostipes sp.]
MKLKKSTVIVIVLSWILFFCACFLIFLKLDKEHTERITNEKIFREETKASEKESTEASSDAQAVEPESDKVLEFMNQYYKKLEAGDEKSLKAMTEDPKDLVSSRIVKKLHKYIESYQNLSFHIEKGADDNSFVVYAVYNTKIRGIKTPAPGMSQYYLTKKGQSYKIYNNEKHYTSQIKNALNAGLGKEKVKELIKETNDAFEKALKSDKKLKKFFDKGKSS